MTRATEIGPCAAGPSGISSYTVVSVSANVNAYCKDIQVIRPCILTVGRPN